ncbi:MULTISPECIES: DUF1127 domain-containing protein, partial [Enterobacteriaceae]
DEQLKDIGLRRDQIN